jgi:hypothetical protein
MSRFVADPDDFADETGPETVRELVELLGVAGQPQPAQRGAVAEWLRTNDATPLLAADLTESGLADVEPAPRRRRPGRRGAAARSRAAG